MAQPNFEKQRKINKNSTLITLVGVGVISALSYWVIDSADQSQLQADKIRIDSANPPPLTLMAFQESADGLTKPLDHLLVGGETTIFKMASVKPVVVALAVSEDQQAPTVVFKDARIPPGPERLVAKFAGPFQYTATPEPHDVRVCLLAGADQQELDNQVAHLAEIWATLPAHRCVQLRRK